MSSYDRFLNFKIAPRNFEYPHRRWRVGTVALATVRLSFPLTHGGWRAPALAQLIFVMKVHVVVSKRGHPSYYFLHNIRYLMNLLPNY